MFNMFWQEVLKGAFSLLVQFTTNCHSIENQTTDLKDSYRESLQFVMLFQWHYIWKLVQSVQSSHFLKCYFLWGKCAISYAVIIALKITSKIGFITVHRLTRCSKMLFFSFLRKKSETSVISSSNSPFLTTKYIRVWKIKVLCSVEYGALSNT